MLNVFMVALTIGTKALRLEGAQAQASTDKLESARDNSLITGETHPDLLYLNDREKDLLAILMVEYLSVLSGTEKDRLVRLAEESGLVRSYFDRLDSRHRWRKARAAENLGYFGGPAAVAPLTPLLGHQDETVRAVAARALARIGTREAAESLAKTLNDPSELTRLRRRRDLQRPERARPLHHLRRRGAYQHRREEAAFRRDRRLPRVPHRPLPNEGQFLRRRPAPAHLRRGSPRRLDAAYGQHLVPGLAARRGTRRGWLRPGRLDPTLDAEAWKGSSMADRQGRRRFRPSPSDEVVPAVGALDRLVSAPEGDAG